MDDERTAAPSRPPSQDDGRIAWLFGPGFPSSGPQRTPPTGAFRCADPDGVEGLTALDTVGRQAMSAQTEQRPAGGVREGLGLGRVSLGALRARLLERIAAVEPLAVMCERGGFIDRDARVDTT